MYYAVYANPEEISKIVLTENENEIKNSKEIPAYSNVHGCGLFREFVVVYKDVKGKLMALATNNRKSHKENLIDLFTAGMNIIYRKDLV